MSGSIPIAVIAFLILAYNAWELGIMRVLIIGIAATGFAIFALVAAIGMQLVNALSGIVNAFQGIG